MTRRKTTVASEGIDFMAAVRDYQIEQVPDELAIFAGAMQAAGVRTMLEIGTGRAAGLARFCAEKLGWTVTTIDIVTPQVELPEDVVFIYLHPGQVAYSMTERFDLVFIDGAHNYESVRADFICYGKLADKVIAFHDVASPHDSCAGAIRFWHEIAYEYRSEGDDVNHVLRDGYHEAIGIGQQAGIGWFAP